MLQRRAGGEGWRRKAHTLLPGYDRDACFVPTRAVRSAFLGARMVAGLRVSQAAKAMMAARGGSFFFHFFRMLWYE